MAVQAAEAGPANQAVLYLRNGDYVAGRFASCPSDEHVHWNSSLFRDAIVFRRAGVQQIVFDQQATPTDSKAIANTTNSTQGTADLMSSPDAGSRIVLAGRNILFGDVSSIDNQWLVAETRRHGTIRVDVDTVRAIQGFAQHPSYLFNPRGNRNAWRSIGKHRAISQWTQQGAQLTTRVKGANLFCHVQDQGPYLVELVLSAETEPDFQVVLGCPQNIRELRYGFSLEKWENRWVICRQASDELKFVEIAQPRTGPAEWSVQFYFDPLMGEVSVLSRGRLLGQFRDRTGLTELDSGFFVRNRGQGLTVSDFRIRRWTGKLRPFDDRGSLDHIELTNGQLLSGQLVGFDAETETVDFVSRSKSIQVNAGEIAEIIFSRDRSVTNAAPTVRIEYLDGGAMAGRYLGVDEAGILVQIPGAAEGVTAGWAEMSHVTFSGTSETSQEQLHKNGLVEQAGCRLHGRVARADQTGAVNWVAAYSNQSTAFDLAQSAQVLFEPRDASDVLQSMTDELFLTNGDTIPCSLEAIDDQGFLIRSVDGTTAVIPHNSFKALRRYPAATQIYAGFQVGDKWYSGADGRGQCKLSAGALTFQGNVCIAKQFDLPPQMRISLELQWLGEASLVIGIGADNAENAVYRIQNRVFTKEMMRQAANQSPDSALEVNLTRKGNTMTGRARTKSLGALGPLRRALHRRNQRVATIALGTSASASIELLLDRVRREYSMRVNGEEFYKWKDGVPLDGQFVYLAAQPVVSPSSSGVQAIDNHNELFRIYNFRISQWCGALPRDDRERMLTRRLGASPQATTHILRATNGDSLRGRLVSLRDNMVYFQARLDRLALPLNRITEIVALRDTEHNASAAALQIRLHGGGRISLDPEKSSESVLSGLSPLAGKLSVPWKLVSAIELGESELGRTPFADWTLRDPPSLPDATSPRLPFSDLVGKPAPDFDLDTLDGKSLSLSSLRGRVVILDFWATWCRPCVASMPSLIDVAERFGEAVKLIAVNQQESVVDIQNFLASQSWHVTIGLDPTAAIAGQYGAAGIPFTVVIDQRGHVRHVHLGALPGFKERLKRQLQELTETSSDT